MPLHLSENFTLSEMCKTDTGLDNICGTDSAHNLYFLCQYLMQPIRGKFGLIDVSSGYRSPEVNDKIGGSRFSQHMAGEACDFGPKYAPLEDVYAWIMGNLNYGQLILYPDREFIHISLPRLLQKNKENLVCIEGNFKKRED